MIFRDFEIVFLHRTTEHIKQTCTLVLDLKLQAGLFQTEEHYMPLVPQKEVGTKIITRSSVRERHGDSMFLRVSN